MHVSFVFTLGLSVIEKLGQAPVQSKGKGLDLKLDQDFSEMV